MLLHTFTRAAHQPLATCRFGDAIYDMMRSHGKAKNMVSRVKCKQSDEMLAGIIYPLLVDVTPEMCMDDVS